MDPAVHLANPLPKSTSTFHSFPNFPTEIRCAIWEQVLSQERLLRLHLFSLREPINFGIRDSIVRWIASKDYDIFVTQPTMSKLFRVNAESRLSALRFYRVQLPCRCVRNDQPFQDGTLYINPELDTLDIRGIHHFVKFAHDLQKHDPHNVGLLNLAVAPNWKLERSQGHLQESNMESLRQVLSRLKRIIWYHPAY